MLELDFWFFPGSTYTYLTVSRIEDRAEQAGVKVNWRPFELRTIIKETNAGPFFPAGSAKRRHMFRDIERRAVALGIPYTGEPPHPIDPDLLALRVALVAADEGWCPEFMRWHYGEWFLENRPSGDGDHMWGILSRMGRDADAVLARAHSSDTTEKMGASADEARRLGLFGSPHFVVGNEVFWGDDRLEDALAWAAL